MKRATLLTSMDSYLAYPANAAVSPMWAPLPTTAPSSPRAASGVSASSGAPSTRRPRGDHQAAHPAGQSPFGTQTLVFAVCTSSPAGAKEAAEAKDLYYPPDPASREDCSIGGNIATNVWALSGPYLGDRTGPPWPQWSTVEAVACSDRM